MDINGIKMFFSMFKFEKDNVLYLSVFGFFGNEDIFFFLCWGEVVLLYFIKNILSWSKVIVLFQLSCRYMDSVEMIFELCYFGKYLFWVFYVQFKKIVVIISVDLVYIYLKLGLYGFFIVVEFFDKVCGVWVESQDLGKLVVKVVFYVNKVFFCGFIGLVMLDGVLKVSFVDWEL